MRLVPAAVMAATLGLVLTGCQTQPMKSGVDAATPALHPSKVEQAQQKPLKDEAQLDLWALTRAHMQLPLDLDQPRLERQLKWYSKHPKYMTRVTERAVPYYHHIIHEVLKRDMPAEIALLPIVESAFDPFAYSHGRAAGPWQFIPGTARHFGLRSSWWYDGRRDILASTDAALTYLQQLNKRFDGDWLLALAAYNAGGGTVNRAIRRNREQGKPTDYWSLDLPSETEAYVPKLLAVARMVRDAEAMNISLTPIDNEPHFDIVKTGGQIDLARAAEMAEMDLKTLYRLNPGFNRWATDPEGPHALLVPIEQAERLRNRIAELPADQRVSWHRYTVKPGDTLSGIAQHFNSSVSVIRQGNRLKGSTIRVGQGLVVPKPSRASEQYALSTTQRKQARIKALEQRNQDSRYHHVSEGESFWSIARHYGVGVRALARWNQMAPGDTLRTGQKLLVIGAGNTQARIKADEATNLAATTLPASIPESVSRAMTRKVGYRIRKGDSLSRIASRFNVSVGEILRWNSLDANTLLRPGQPLTLYVNIADAR
ncbi:lytic transglycosylase [Marinobacterium weihaiense]|uniref:LysM peptidoglycan-binding domain-containing protein n=1 Tax=Marinobacterium weihaiense TaxID=2851016 RepID=A0ABS6M7B8_9GAMM|nr:LysM peptidoglycan-binding domain-containing protein [Marinobacterium weihaiense]MBV0932180.1 LysM peptidoglycan-binding domain-containing protein [Marinobacterium weihaiense]